jgi:hypothetical protein
MSSVSIRIGPHGLMCVDKVDIDFTFTYSASAPVYPAVLPSFTE